MAPHMTSSGVTPASEKVSAASTPPHVERICALRVSAPFVCVLLCRVGRADLIVADRKSVV